MTASKPGIWRDIALFCLGVTLSGTVFFIKDTIREKGYVTKEEVEDMIDHVQYPWIADRPYVIKTLDKLEKKVDYLVEQTYKNGARSYGPKKKTGKI